MTDVAHETELDPFRELRRRGFSLPEGGVPTALGLVNLYDFERHARFVLSGELPPYVSDGHYDEITAGRSRYVFDSLGIVPRYLTGNPDIDITTTVLGQPVKVPVLLGPTLRQRVFHPAGELASCAAAGAAGTIATVGAGSGYEIADVRAASAGPLWCELMLTKDRGRVTERIAEAESAGCVALCFTTDTVLLAGAERRLVDASYFDAIDPAAGLAELEWLRAVTDLPIAVRGILRPDDARACAEAGAAAVIVSSHAARAVDGVLPPIEALAAIVDEVDGSAEVILDGGVRRGVDAFRAVALGATAVMIGRPVLWGLATAGSDGVRRVLDILAEELVYAMRMSGRPSLAAVDRSALRRVATLFETPWESATVQAPFDRRRRPGSEVNRHWSKSSRWTTAPEDGS